MGGSGIQWPCNEKYPEGKKRLFDDNVFFTDIDYTESYGHDMETEAPISRAKYIAMNPAGRLTLKAAEYIPALGACGDKNVSSSYSFFRALHSSSTSPPRLSQK